MDKPRNSKISKSNLIVIKLLSNPRLRGLLVAFRLKRVLRSPISIKKLNYQFSYDKTVSNFDLIYSKRILTFLLKNINDISKPSKQTDASPWAAIVASQSELIRIVKSKNAHALAEYLLEAPKNNILTGVLQGKSEYEQLKISSKYRKVQGKILLQRLLRLANAIGTGTDQNPEQGSWGIRNPENFDQLYNNLYKTFGPEIEIPDFFSGLFRIKFGSTHWNQVELMSMNSAHQIKNLLDGDTSKVILEIGAGIGYTTFWLKKLGFELIAIIDLPHVIAAQAFFLMKAFPECRIYLHGESQWNNDYDIAIFPNSVPLEHLPLSPNLIFNQDSFAEMSTLTINHLLKSISKFSDSLLYSINHESEATYDESARSQMNIAKVISQKEHFRLRSRVPNWIREGYVDQIWEIL